MYNVATTVPYTAVQLVISNTPLQKARRSCEHLQRALVLLIAANPSFGCDPPIKRLPAGLTQLGVQWFAGVFYMVSFTRAPAGLAGGQQ